MGPRDQRPPLPFTAWRSASSRRGSRSFSHTNDRTDTLGAPPSRTRQMTVTRDSRPGPGCREAARVVIHLSKSSHREPRGLARLGHAPRLCGLPLAFGVRASQPASLATPRNADERPLYRFRRTRRPRRNRFLASDGPPHRLERGRRVEHLAPKGSRQRTKSCPMDRMASPGACASI